MFKNLLFVSFITIFLCVHNIYSQSFINGTVVDVVDGRTLVVENSSGKKLNVQLRFLEVPETGQPLAEVIKNHLRELTSGKRIEVVGMRLLSNRIIGTGTILEKGNKLDLSGQMMRDGAGWFDIYDEEGAVSNFADVYKKIEAAAKNEKRGVWGIAGMKTPWDYRSEKAADLTKSAENTAPVKEIEPDEPSYAKTINNLPGGKLTVRRMAIFDPYFASAPGGVNGNKPGLPATIGAAGTGGSGLSANLSQVYFAQFNKGSVSTKPFEVTVQNGSKKEKVTAMFVYDYTVENADKNIGKVGMLILSELKTKPLLQGKTVGLYLDDDTKIDFGVSKYYKSKSAESIIFENIERSKLLAIPASSSLTLMIGKTKTEIDPAFKQIIDEFITTLR